MGSNPVVIGALVLGETSAVAWAVWELWKLRPAAKDGERPAPDTAKHSAEAPRLPDPAGHPEREHGPHDG
jgi:hypothetical protein